MNIDGARRRYDNLERWSEPVLLVITLLFVGVALLGEVDRLSANSQTALTTVEWVLWFVFPFEFALMFVLSPDRMRFLRVRWWEIPIMVLTLPALAVFLAWLAPARFLRFLRSARVVRTVRLSRFGGLLARYTRGIRIVLTRHGLQYVLSGAVVLYAMSTFLVYLVERGDNRPIQTFPEALWWGITAVTTLPDDGNVPTTVVGRGIAVVVVFLGLTVVSLITANIAAFLIHSEASADSAKISALYNKLDRIEEHLGIPDVSDEHRTRSADDQGTWRHVTVNESPERT
jgi:voltage-gated potassium channel